MELKEWRQHTGLTLDELSAQIGCSTSALSLIERGKRKPGYELTIGIIRATKGKVRAEDLHNGK